MKKFVRLEACILALAGFVLLVSSCGSKSQNVVNGTITVGPAAYKYYTAVVQSGMNNARLTGTFTATGGILNAIKVEVMDSGNYANWTNGQQSTPIFKSGMISTDTLNVYLPSAGTYYLVYDNTWSTVTKQVRTTVDLDYE